MKAKELRIGNLFSYMDKVSEIIGITQDQSDLFIGESVDRFSIEFSDGDSICLIGVNNIHVKPIPLTEYWLCDKLGFKPLKGKKIGYRNGDFVLVSDGLVAWVVINGKPLFVDYVHELQNVFFTLRKFELELKQ